jgi:hypothetical protein
MEELCAEIASAIPAAETGVQPPKTVLQNGELAA